MTEPAAVNVSFVKTEKAGLKMLTFRIRQNIKNEINTMILDALENAHQYFAINKGFEKAFNFLTRPK